MTRFTFESALEKLGRIMARQYNVEVIFEGNQACTDGKKIILPYFAEMTDEFRADLNGYLDHEVAHIKFTEFPEIKKVVSRFHKELLNATEDCRIERLMIKEFAGTALNLAPLNEKCQKQWAEKWTEIPWPIRTIKTIRDLMEGRTPIADAEIEPYINSVRDLIDQLNDCKTTRSLRVLTEQIVRKISEAREEEKKAEASDEGDSSEEQKGEGDSHEECDGDSSEGDDSESSDGDSGDDSGESSDSESSGDESSEEAKSESHRAPDGGSTEGSEDKSRYDDLLNEADGKMNSAYDEHIQDIHSLINDEIKEQIKNNESKSRRDPEGLTNGAISIPMTTRFDTETDHSGKGNSSVYAHMKRDIMPLVQPIKSQLERILKVSENAKWTPERERGSLDPRSLAKLGSQPNYRTVFREYTKTQTNNVAVEIMIDMSGSMGKRMETAKRTAVAMAEALKDLNIPFEITGFNSKPDARLRKMINEMNFDESRRFNRMAESLDLHIFKSFDSHSLNGITNLFVGQQNPDGECVFWAAKRLAQRKEKRKIMLVLSDGEPATTEGRKNILQADLKNRIKQLRKSGIECIGIGIMTDCVKHFYPDYVVISEISDLPKAAMKKLSALIAKGAA